MFECDATTLVERYNALTRYIRENFDEGRPIEGVPGKASLVSAFALAAWAARTGNISGGDLALLSFFALAAQGLIQCGEGVTPDEALTEYLETVGAMLRGAALGAAQAAQDAPQ